MEHRKDVGTAEREPDSNGSGDPIDPLDAVLDAAPYDDEPLTEEEAAAEEAGWAEYLRGESDPWEEVRRRLLDEADISRSAAR